MISADPKERIEAVRRHLRSGDADQLLFQLSEIVVGEVYASNGISLSEGSIVLDVGANVGVSALYFAVVCGARPVYSFEPAPASFEALRLNVAHVPEVQPRNVGLASWSGRRQLTYYPSEPVMSGFFADPSRDEELLQIARENMGVPAEDAEKSTRGRLTPESVACDVITLSEFLDSEGLERVDLLKVDVERAEIEVLRGIRREHWACIRQVVIETHEHEHTETAVAMLREQGFATTVIQDPALTDTPVSMVYALRKGE